jgi:CHAT domain-containing protein
MVLRSIASYYTSNLEEKLKTVLLVGEPDNPDLPAVEAEFQGIKATFDSVTITSAKENLKPILQKSSAVHFGVHAFFDRSNPVASGLRLRDGTLTLDEIVMLEAFRTRVVTMGACRTAEAEVSSIGDEVWSLATGFMFAGIPAAISSIWEQDGEASRIFFTAFYKFLARNGDVGAAFRKALIHVRHAQDWRNMGGIPGLMNHSNPAFWAGFLFLGE